MTSFIYRQTEPTLFTVGHYWNDGTRDQWEPESDHGTAEEAAQRVRFLNGGGPVGICGARHHTATGPYAHLFICTEQPGHVEAGTPDHRDGTRAGAPAATWRDPAPERPAHVPASVPDGEVDQYLDAYPTPHA